MNKLLLLIVVFLISCSKQTEDLAVLSGCDQRISLEIPDDVRIPYTSVFSFSDDGKQYLSFENHRENEIVIYDIESSQMVKRIRFETEGNNAIMGGFGGYYIVDMNHIFIPSLYMSTICVTDTTSVIKQQINYQSTKNGLILVPFLPSYASQMNFIGNNLYIPQTLNRTLKEKVISDSPVRAVVDTISKEVKSLPMKFPPLMTDKDLGTVAAVNCDYSSCYDGTNFVYSFFFDENVYITSPEHEIIDKKIAKSKYIDNIEKFSPRESNMQKIIKLQCEHAAYGHIMFDKYREVYYRFVYPSTSTDDYKGDYVDLFRSGRKVFSVMILDKQLNVIGETLFPEYTFNPKLSFILEDGLYISLNHINNPEYSDDLFQFQKFELEHR